MKNNIELVVRGEIIDLDDATAIGISFEGFDFNEPEKIHLSYSNEFTLPFTNTNRRVFGFLDSMEVNSAVVYDKFYGKEYCKLYVDGVFVFGGSIYCNGLSDGRISVSMISSKDITEVMKSYTMYDVTSIIVSKLNDELDEAYTTGANFSDIINFAKTGENDIWLPYVVGSLNMMYPYSKVDSATGITSCGNLYNDTDNDSDRERYNLNNESVLTTEFVTDSQVVGDYKTGCFFVRLSFILETIFAREGYSVSFSNELGSTIGRQFLRMQDIVIWKDLITNNYSFRCDNHSHYRIGDEGKPSSMGKSFLELFKTVCQEYCLVFDIDNEQNIIINTLNDLKTIDVKEFNNDKVKERLFELDGINQKGWIAYSDLGDKSTTTGGKMVVCNNNKLEYGGDELVEITIERYLPSYFVYLYENSDNIKKMTYALNVSDTAINDKFVFVQKIENDTPYDVTVKRIMVGETVSTDVQLYRAYNNTIQDTGLWDLFIKNCEYPEVIKLDVLVSNYELIKWSSFNLVRFSSIPGTWYVSHIENYNPRLPNSTVQITAIRIR